MSLLMSLGAIEVILVTGVMFVAGVVLLIDKLCQRGSSRKRDQ